MRILFDQGTPVPLREHLTQHEVQTAYELGWSDLQNGDLLAAAEGLFDIFVTTDQQIQYQQNLTRRRLAILVLLTTSWPRIQTCIPQIQDAVEDMTPGEYLEISIT